MRNVSDAIEQERIVGLQKRRRRICFFCGNGFNGKREKMKVSLNIDYNSGNYAYSTDCEIHDTIKDALNSFWRSVDDERISDGNEFIGYLFIGQIKDCTDLFPDYEIHVGKRGAIICNRCLA